MIRVILFQVFILLGGLKMYSQERIDLLLIPGLQQDGRDNYIPISQEALVGISEAVCSNPAFDCPISATWLDLDTLQGLERFDVEKVFSTNGRIDSVRYVNEYENVSRRVATYFYDEETFPNPISIEYYEVIAPDSRTVNLGYDKEGRLLQVHLEDYFGVSEAVHFTYGNNGDITTISQYHRKCSTGGDENSICWTTVIEYNFEANKLVSIKKSELPKYDYDLPNPLLDNNKYGYTAWRKEEISLQDMRGRDIIKAIRTLIETD